MIPARRAPPSTGLSPRNLSVFTPRRSTLRPIIKQRSFPAGRQDYDSLFFCQEEIDEIFSRRFPERAVSNFLRDTGESLHASRRDRRQGTAPAKESHLAEQLRTAQRAQRTPGVFLTAMSIAAPTGS